MPEWGEDAEAAVALDAIVEEHVEPEPERGEDRLLAAKTAVPGDRQPPPTSIVASPPFEAEQHASDEAFVVRTHAVSFELEMAVRAGRDPLRRREAARNPRAHAAVPRLGIREGRAR